MTLSLSTPRYMKLVRPNDDSDFTMNSIFAVQEGFTFCFVSTNATPTEDTKSKVLVYRIA